MTNIKFGEYVKEPQKKGYVNVRIGVFFDGTQNNRRNSQAGGREDGYTTTENDRLVYKNKSNKKDDSYTNDLSNVARKEYHYKESLKNYVGKIYIEGIGTNDLAGDSDKKLDHSGVAYGAGDTGIKKKAGKGCKEIIKKIQEFPTGFKIDTIVLDVFGFSRGAAAARHFVYDVKKNKPNIGFLESLLDDNKIDFLKIEIRFLGLYDTVSSFDPEASQLTLYPNFRNDVTELHLNELKARTIFHLTADDEHRENFMITKVRYAGAIDYFLPGVHSDIGGCYVHGMKERKQIMDTDNFPGGLSKEKHLKILNNDLNNLIAQGWVHRSETEAPNKWNETYLKRSKISNRYSFVTLHIMAEKVNKEYSDTINLANLTAFYKIPNGSEDKYFNLDLTKVKARLDEYIKGNKPKIQFYSRTQIEEFRKLLPIKKITEKRFDEIVGDYNMLIMLRNRYLHWNSEFGELGYAPHYKIDKVNLDVKRWRETAPNS